MTFMYINFVSIQTFYEDLIFWSKFVFFINTGNLMRPCLLIVSEILYESWKSRRSCQKTQKNRRIENTSIMDLFV